MCIVVKNYVNVLNNFLVYICKDVGFEVCNIVLDCNFVIVLLFWMIDCFLILDGVVVIILVVDDVVEDMVYNIGFCVVIYINDYFLMLCWDVLVFEGLVKVIYILLLMVGVILEDISFVEVYDCFIIVELLIYEVMGLMFKGQGVCVINDGLVYVDGKLLVNVFGGFKVKGYLVGVIGVFMYVLVV